MATYQLIASNTVGSGGTASVTFSSIPSTYTDLIVKTSCRSSAAVTSDFVRFYFNGSDANGTLRELFGTGSSTGSFPDSQQRINYISGNNATANTFGSGEVYIPNYTLSNFKSSGADSVSENNATSAVASITANLWSSTAAITSITLVPGTALANFMQYTTFYLYGIKNS
jgi:hypothetical protein